jgi:hypothetical protein
VTPIDDLQDHVLHGLGGLKHLTPDPARSSRVRARCHAQLARSRSRSEQSAAAAGLVRRLFAPAVVLTGCALYVASLVSTVLRVRSLIDL